MTPNRWQYLKSLRPTARLFWNSGARGTYYVGSNAVKRQKRALAKVARAALVARRVGTTNCWAVEKAG